jgi:hypothetical protein
MINRLAGILFISAISFTAICQTTETKKSSARPDIPGTFTLELGLNRSLNGPDNFKIGLWGSRTINVYYQYEMRILKSKFSFIPGIGLSLERFKFRDGDILGYVRESNLFANDVTSRDTLFLFAPGQHFISRLKKSQLITNYVDLPLELRYTFNPDDPARSLKISIGGRIGYLYDASTKIKYSQDGEQKQIKDKQNFNLTRFRYGAFAKIGFGNFSLFGYYNLTPLFKKDQGLFDTNKVPFNDMNTFTAGISLSSF